MNRKLLLAANAAVAVAVGVGAWYWLQPGASGGADPDNAVQVAAGKAVYAAQCASCHGVRLEGQPNWRSRNPDGTLPAPPHDESGHTWHHPDELLFDVTNRGGQASAPAGFTSAMPGFGEALSDDRIWAVLAYIKSRWPARIRKISQRINQQARAAR